MLHRRPTALLLRARLVTIPLMAGAITIAAFKTVQTPSLVHILLAVIIAGSLMLVSVRRPALSVLLTFAFLVVLALTRRLLIPLTGWDTYDPLLLVAPAVSLFMLARMFVGQKRQLAPDTFSRLILALVALCVLESANPLGGGGLLAGVAGLLFIATPLLWFFIGREVADRRSVATLLGITVVWAVADAVYGLRQALGALPSWDAAWLDLGGYTALRIHGNLRSFGTLTSGSEYATYLGIALVVALAMVIYRRPLALVAVPILGWALFLNSTRMVALLVLVALIVLSGLRMRRRSLGAGVILLGVGAAAATATIFGPALDSSAQDSANPLIVHEVGGLVHPLDPQQSTLIGHSEQILRGISYGFRNPLGLGTAATNIAGDKFGASTLGTDSDVSNLFASLGVVGGMLFLAIIVMAFRITAGVYRREPDLVPFAIAGVLIVSLGQWLNGGQYATAPLLWYLLGWVAQAWRRNSPQLAQPAFGPAALTAGERSVRQASPMTRSA